MIVLHRVDSSSRILSDVEYSYCRLIKQCHGVAPDLVLDKLYHVTSDGKTCPAGQEYRDREER